MSYYVYIIVLAVIVVVLAVVIFMIRQAHAAQQADNQIKLIRTTTERDRLLSELHDLETAMQQVRFDHLRLAKDHHDRSAILQNLHSRITKYKSEGSATASQLSKLLSIIDKDADQEKDALIIHLEQVNSSYVDRLKAAHPHLTVYDYRLCTFIKSGMSTREIAKLLNVLPSSVNVSRSRLRKKLSLTVKDDLYTVLNEL